VRNGVRLMCEFVIRLEKIGYKAGYRNLLKDITWDVKQGEHWVVFGMNGSGKTTLLSIIAGFKQATSGKIQIFGDPFSNENILEIRKRIGWVSSSFFDKFYTKESALNIVLSGKFGTLGLAEELTLEDVALAKTLLEELHLGDKINHTFDLFSKGERQNILIARALFSNPDILILDEPCTGLDIYNRSYLFSTLDGLCKKKDLTILYVTHYVEEITPLFDKALLLKNGHIFAQGSIDEMFNSAMMQELLGYPVRVEQKRDRSYNLQIETESALVALLK